MMATCYRPWCIGEAVPGGRACAVHAEHPDYDPSSADATVCRECDGMGTVDCVHCDGTGQVECDTCKGTGDAQELPSPGGA